MNFFKFEDNLTNTQCCFLEEENRVSRSGLKPSKADSNNRKNPSSRHAHKLSIPTLLESKALHKTSLKQKTPEKSKLSLSKLFNPKNSQENNQGIRKSNFCPTIITNQNNNEYTQLNSKPTIREEKYIANIPFRNGFNCAPQVFLTHREVKVPKYEEYPQREKQLENQRIQSARHRNSNMTIKNSLTSETEPPIFIGKANYSQIKHEEFLTQNLLPIIPELALSISNPQNEEHTKEAQTATATVETDRQMLASESGESRLKKQSDSPCKTISQKYDVSESRLTDNLSPILEKPNLKTVQSIYSEEIGVVKREIHESIILMDYFNPPETLKREFEAKINKRPRDLYE